MLNRKASTFVQFLYMFILHCGLFGIIQYNNGTEFMLVVILFLAWYDIKIINGRLWTPFTQRLVEQVNDFMKNKFSKKIEATGNSKWSKNLICIALAMNTQGYSRLLFNMTAYEVFFWSQISGSG